MSAKTSLYKTVTKDTGITEKEWAALSERSRKTIARLFVQSLHLTAILAVARAGREIEKLRAPARCPECRTSHGHSLGCSRREKEADQLA